jgi:acetyl-CoA acetyltransferase
VKRGEALAAIVGVAESDLGETNKTMLQLHTQAILGALDDAGLKLADVDGIATTGLSRFAVSQLAEYLGLQPRWMDGTFAGGASFEIFAADAARAIRAGLCDVVVVSSGSNQRTARSRRLGGASEPAMPPAQFEEPYAPLNPISLYAMAAQRHMHDFGTTPEQLAEVAVAARQWALLNPKAFHHDSGPIATGDVLRSSIVSSPLHVLDCCLVTDGAGAIVMTSRERAAGLKHPSVSVIGHGVTTTNVSMASIPDLTSTGARESSARALDMAGLNLSEIDVVQVYDSFTITVLLTLEAIGFCKRGESGRFVEGGRLGPTGDFPINTSGGGLSYCQPGMFGIFLLIEAVRQLRGEAGRRQLPRHATALCHGTGGILSTHATTVLVAQ